MKKQNCLIEMESLFLALSDKTRLRLLNLMRGGEVCVNSFTEILGESQPKISRHLAYLKTAGIVSARREGKWVYYKIDIPNSLFAENILQKMLVWMENQEDLHNDYGKLHKTGSSFDNSEKNFQDISPNICGSSNIKPRIKEELEIFLL